MACACRIKQVTAVSPLAHRQNPGYLSSRKSVAFNSKTPRYSLSRMETMSQFSNGFWWVKPPSIQDGGSCQEILKTLQDRIPFSLKQTLPEGNTHHRGNILSGVQGAEDHVQVHGGCLKQLPQSGTGWGITKPHSLHNIFWNIGLAVWYLWYQMILKQLMLISIYWFKVTLHQM